MLSPGQLLSFVVACAALVALVPLGVWFATGSRVQAARALRGYGAFVLVLAALIALGAVAGFIASAFTP